MPQTRSQHCPQCKSENIYEDRDLLVCADCAHEWNAAEVLEADLDDQCRDANGVVLRTGDSVILIKDLKVKGSAGSLKGGTKVRNIRVIDPVDGHNISCKIDGFGGLNLKSEFVKKA